MAGSRLPNPVGRSDVLPPSSITPTWSTLRRTNRGLAQTVMPLAAPVFASAGANPADKAIPRRLVIFGSGPP